MLTGYVPPARIVVVDDDEDDRMLLGLALDEAALYLPVTYLSDGTEAIAYFAACRDAPALLITDLNMPLVGGLELLSFVRQRHATRTMPTVVLTTSMADDDRQRCYRAGVSAYVTKPVTLPDYIELVRDLVQHWVFEPTQGVSRWKQLCEQALPTMITDQL